MLRQTLGLALGSIFQRHARHRQGVITNDDFANDADVGLRRTGLLVLPGITHQISIESLSAAIEVLDRVVASEFFDASDIAHRRVPASKKPSSFKRRSRRGRGRGGASSAAMNSFH